MTALDQLLDALSATDGPDLVIEARAEIAHLREEAARVPLLRQLADVAASEQGLAQRRMMDAQRQRDAHWKKLAVLRLWCLDTRTRGGPYELCADQVQRILKEDA